MKYFIFFILIIFFLQESSAQVNNNPGTTSITIKSSKDVYLESEPIWIEFDVKLNRDIKIGKPVSINISDGLNVVLINEKGDTMKYSRSITDWVYFEDVYQLERYFKVINLIRLEGLYNEDIPDTLITDGFRLKPGNYKFRAVLYLTLASNGNPHNYPEGKLVSYPFYSNEIQFEVKTAEGVEAEAREKMFDMIRKWRNADIDKVLGNAPRNTEFIRSADEFRKLYPNSVYWDFIENNVFRHNGYAIGNDMDSSITDLLKLIQEKPNNYFNNSYISHLLHSYKIKRSNIENTLKQISEKYKGTLLQKLIDSRIEEENAENSFLQKMKRKQKE